MARIPVFFLSIIVICGGMIGLAVKPMLDQTAAPVSARAQAGALVVDLAGLRQFQPATGLPIQRPPGLRRDLVGVRLTADSALGPDARHSKGARLKLSPETAARLVNRPVSVVMIARAAPQVRAQRFAVAWIGAEAAQWVVQPVTNRFSTVRFDLPALQAPPRALAVWADVDGRRNGIEVKELRFEDPIATPLPALDTQPQRQAPMPDQAPYQTPGSPPVATDQSAPAVPAPAALEGPARWSKEGQK